MNDIDKGIPGNDPMLDHQCVMIARSHACSPGREFWLGKLTEPIPDYPHETHCLHITTPAKSVVFGVNLGDMAFLSVFAMIVHGVPFNERWLKSMEQAMRNEAEHYMDLDEETKAKLAEDLLRHCNSGLKLRKESGPREPAPELEEEP